jgi:hypothetical protein
VESALKNLHWQFVIDGKAVVLGIDGVADFDACTAASMTPRRSAMHSTFSRSMATTCGVCRYPAQDQPRPSAGAPAGKRGADVRSDFNLGQDSGSRHGVIAKPIPSDWKPELNHSFW